MLTKKNAILAAIIFVCIISAFYVLSGNGPGGQTGFDAIKAGIGNTLSKQRTVSNKLGEFGAEIDGSINTIGDIRKSNNNARESIEAIKRENSNSRELIEDNRKRLTECQSIVDRMEKGAEQGDNKAKTGS